MSNVINLDSARTPPGRPIVICPCGSGWWRPRGVVFEEDGTICGWAGPVTCTDCGAPLPPGGRRPQWKSATTS